MQTRHLSGVRVPLVSHGRASLSASGVEWRVTEPVDVVTQINAGGVTQSVNGGPAQRVGADGGFVTTTGLVDLISGNFSALQTYYDVARRAGAHGDWSLRLTPKAEALSRFVSFIDVAGCEGVRDVEVRQANGDWMSIAFTQTGQ